MAGTFIIPGKTFHGLGSFSQVSTIVGKKALIVTDQDSMKRSGFIEKSN